MRIALCQVNPTVGAVKKNAETVLALAKEAKQKGCDIAFAPEMVLCGYPPQDVLFRPELLLQVDEALADLANASPIPVVVGAPVSRQIRIGQPLWNAAVLCHQGEIQVVCRKSLLPNYDVFDERRYFEPWQQGDGPNGFELGGIRFGMTICEDVWNDAAFWKHRLYLHDPVEQVVSEGADVIVNIAASPFCVGKPEKREAMLRHAAKKFGKPLLMVGQVGANDQLTFDGSSCAIGADGKVSARANAFKEEILIVESGARVEPFSSHPESMAQAISVGIRDYVEKCGAKGVLVGMSGGIDSSVVACLAIRGLGPNRVTGVRMSSKYTAAISEEDAAEVAGNLGIQLIDIPIETVVDSMRKNFLAQMSNGPQALDIADQNLQARARGVALMALSNARGGLVLSPGNKSELAVGYSTLYGDMCGALSPIGDVYKTEVWQLANWLNQEKPLIPQRVIDRKPSAELRPDQTDQDTLPPYNRLDQVLVRYIEQNKSVQVIEKETGFDNNEIERVVKMVHAAQYKRKQSAIQIMVSERNFDKSFRWPIAQGFKPL